VIVVTWIVGHLDVILGLCALVGTLYAAYTKVLRPWYRRKVSPLVEGVQSLVMLPHVVRTTNQMVAMEKTISSIAAEVRPNGGSSLRDAINRVETNNTAIADSVGLIAGTLRANMDTDPSRGMFECSPDGQNIWVSKTYCRWLNRTEGELLGFGFLSCIHVDDRETVREEWEHARRDVRPYGGRMRLLRTDGSVLLVDVAAVPLLRDGKAQRWTGSVRKAVDV
jgi:PAS domain S-box-containing protein